MTAQERFNHKGVAVIETTETTFFTSRTTVGVLDEPIRITLMAGRRHLRVNMDAREAKMLGQQLLQHAELAEVGSKERTGVYNQNHDDNQDEGT